MKLIFVYNADSGLVNTLMDIGHKAISPQTYECNLCGLTFGVLSEHKQWKKFRENANIDMEFLHRDEFEQKCQQTLASRYNGSQTHNALAQKFEYPVILKEDNDLSIAMSSTQLNKIKTLDELITQVKQLSN